MHLPFRLLIPNSGLQFQGTHLSISDSHWYNLQYHIKIFIFILKKSKKTIKEILQYNDKFIRQTTLSKLVLPAISRNLNLQAVTKFSCSCITNVSNNLPQG